MVRKTRESLFFSKKFYTLTFVFLLFFSGIFFTNTEAASDKITVDVKQRMQKGEQVSVIILLKDQPSFKAMSKDNAIASQKSHASNSQKSLAALLNEEKGRGKANKIKQFWIVNAIALKASPELIEKLAKRDDVASIELDGELRIIEDVSSQVSQGQIDNATSEIRRINATRVWELGIDGTGINVSVIDTGINASHPDIAGRVIKWADFVNGNNASAYDDHGHGTHVAGTVGGNGSRGTTTGVAPNVSLFGAKVLDSTGSGYISDVVSGVQWSVSNGADILSLSLGTYTFSQSLSDAINNSINSGIVVIAAAGNCGPDGNPSNCPTLGNGTISYPAAQENVVAVGATDSADLIAGFSSRGPTTDGRIKPDVSAPGVNINSIVPSGSCTYCDASGYKLLSGTSMATPHVSGAVALLLQAAQRNGTTLTPSQVKTILEDTSIDLGTSGKDNTYGAGRINVSAAVLSIDASPPSVVANPTGYIGSNTAAKNGTSITLNATITDVGFGVKNASVNASSINASLGNVTLTNVSGYWINSSVIVNASDGTYYLNVTAYDNVSNVNRSVQLSVTVDTTNPRILNASASNYTIEAGSGTSILRVNASDNTSGVARVTVNLSETGGSSNASMQNNSGIWELTVNSTAVGNFTLVVNATDGAGNYNTSTVLLNTTDTRAPVINSARASPDSIIANGIENTTLIVNTYDFANVSSIRNVTVNLTLIGGNATQELVNSSGTWQLNVSTNVTGRNGTLLRLPVNVTDTRNNSNTSASILLGIKAQVNTSLGNRTSFNFTIDSRAFNASITIPASADLSGGLQIAPVDVPSLNGLTSAGVAVNFSNLTFNTSLKIEVEYNSTFFNDSANISKLRLWSYNTTTAAWNITENSSVNTQNNTVSGNTTHFSVFAPLADTTPPVITSVAASSITTGSATITWTTDEASQSLVKYGTASGSYTSDANDTSNVTSHSIQLTGLSSSTTYYFVANSTDQSGNSNQSSENSFTTSSSGGGSSGGGGGGGGGGGASTENASNIVVREKHDLHIFKDKVTSYAFTNGSNPVQFVNITGNINAGEITASVEALKNTSSLVKIPPPGIVYKNINIWVGTSGFATPKNIKEAVITFRTENSWLGMNSLEGSDVKMVKWDGEKWLQLDTAEKSRNSTFTYFEAKTGSFSSFAITGLKSLITPAQATGAATPTPAIQAETTPAPVLEKEKDTSGILTVTTVVLATIAIMLAAMYLKRKKR